MELSQDSAFEDQIVNVDSTPNSPHSEASADILTTSDDLTDGNILDVEGDTNSTNNSKSLDLFIITMYNILKIDCSDKLIMKENK